MLRQPITLLSVQQYAEVMGLNPWEFNQVGAGVPTWHDEQCEHVWYQHQWQRDFLSRVEVAQAIADAEYALADVVGYYAAPKFFVNEEHRFPRPFKDWVYGAMGTPRGQWKSVQTNWHKVVGGGVLARTELTAGAAVVYSDSDGDGIDDLFTVTQAVTTETADELALYFVSADRLGNALDESWRVRPIDVSISGGVATLTGHRSLLVKPSLQEPPKPVNLDATNAAHFVTTVDVYRTYRDTTATNATPNQGTAIWKYPPGCNADCSVQYTGICLGNTDSDQGWVTVEEAPANWPYGWEPDLVRLNYLAGVPLVGGRMDQRWATIVARLATAMLPSEKCGCERSNRIIRAWRMLPSDGAGDARSLTLAEIDDNPFGPRQGARYAWQRIHQGDMLHITGVSVR